MKHYQRLFSILVCLYLSQSSLLALGQSNIQAKDTTGARLTILPIWDCNDTSPSINPNQAEVPANLIDDDCDGLADEDINGNPSTNVNDADGDGDSPATGDCNDTLTFVSSSSGEIAGNLIDDDCDSFADEDDNGVLSFDELDHDNDTFTVGINSIFSDGFENN